MVEENFEIWWHENASKNAIISHYLIWFQNIPILNVIGNWEKLGKVHSRPIFKNPNFKCYWELGKIGKYTLDEYSKIPILDVIGNWEKLGSTPLDQYSIIPISIYLQIGKNFQYHCVLRKIWSTSKQHFESMDDELGKVMPLF